jgi:hypothetical protein
LGKWEAGREEEMRWEGKSEQRSEIEGEDKSGELLK